MEAVDHLSRALQRFTEEVEPILLSCERISTRAQEALAERLADCGRLIATCETEVQQARRDLAHCEADEDTDCSEYEADVSSARRRLRAAESELARAERWQPSLSEAVTDFRLQSRRLRQLLATQGAQAQAFLRERLAHLDLYSGQYGPGLSADQAASAAALSGATGAAQSPQPGAEQFDAQDIRKVASVLYSIPSLKPDMWKRLRDHNARLEALQEAETGIAAVVGRPVLPVLPAPLGPGEFGQCDGQVIWVNEEYLEPEFHQQMILTVVHEGRHAYQYYACANPGVHSDTLDTAAWQWNVQPGNYINSQDNPVRYRTQPVEADAFAYEEAVMDSYLSLGGS